MVDVSRRTVLQGLAAASAATGLAVTGEALSASAAVGDAPGEADYVVIGSGPGGSPLAARLAEAGHSVVVLEAGPSGGDPTFYDTPVLWPKAVTDEQIRWDFFVRHYTDVAKHGKQYVADRGGVLYPRTGALGGCTAHHAMFTVYPEHSDWEGIRTLTGDAGWSKDRMWGCYGKVKQWLTEEQPLPLRGLIDPQLVSLVAAAGAEDFHLPPGGFRVGPSPNGPVNVDISAQGFYLAPLCSRYGRRRGPRERLLEVARSRPNLTVTPNALVERVVTERTDDGRRRAVAVEYLAGQHLYKASPLAQEHSAAERDAMRRTIRVRKEVIVAGGAINSPQILMLSGIGPADHLRSVGIEPVIDLPGVGGNLQDRVESFVVTELDREFTALHDATWGEPGDPLYANWKTWGSPALYSTSGSPAWIKRRYSKGTKENELVIFGLPGRFEGFVPNFDKIALGKPSRYWSWLILKAHAKGDLGTVRLTSKDPTDVPFVNKRSLGDGEGGEYDIDAVKEAIGVARGISKRANLKGREIVPGPDADLDAFVRKEQFGHHMACTNPIGPAGDPKAVLDSKLRVHGTSNLRVVDASSFPKIPGVFIWLPIAIMSEKAAADILAGS